MCSSCFRNLSHNTYFVYQKSNKNSKDLFYTGYKTMRKLVCFAVIFDCCFGLGSYYRRKHLTEVERLNYNETFFPSLENYQVGAVPVSEVEYPWVARVVHSRRERLPHVCTASCVTVRVFITAARCIYNLKVVFTSVVYLDTQLKAQAFVFPSNITKQQFDDIGLIVVHRGHNGPWPTVELQDLPKRTDKGFQWFGDLTAKSGPLHCKVVGYTSVKNVRKLRREHRMFDLTELPVIVDINLCHTILTYNHWIKGFYVPCYHSCSLTQFFQGPENCAKYHGVEGGAVINTSSNKLVGVATWGGYYWKHELPVGIAVPNSKSFFEDYACAKKIRDYNGAQDNFSYQNLCKR